MEKRKKENYFHSLFDRVKKLKNEIFKNNIFEFKYSFLSFSLISSFRFRMIDFYVLRLKMIIFLFFFHLIFFSYKTHSKFILLSLFHLTKYSLKCIF